MYEIKVSAGLVPSEGCERESGHASLLASGGLLTIFGIFAYRCIILISDFIFT